MAQTPSCPRCGSEVQPTWDWCHACGFDPAGLKPAERPAAPAPAPRAAPAAAPAPGAAPPTWVAPAPTAGRARTREPVSTLVDVGAARPQAMRDPDWVQTEPRKGLPLPAVVGLVAVVAAAVVGLVVVTLIVLHRPIGTADNGAQQLGAAVAAPGPTS